MSGTNISKLFPFGRLKMTDFTVFDGKRILVKIEPDKRYTPLCSGCRRGARNIHSYRKRLISDLPMCGHQVKIEYTYRIVWCERCGLKVEHHDFIEPYLRVTNRFAAYIYQLCQVMTILDVSEHTGLSWDQVRYIDKRTLKKRFGGRVSKHLEVLCIDEVSIKKRHNYLTIIADYFSGRVVAVIKTRKYTAVASFLKSLPKKTRKGIKAVAMDMWDPYIRAFRKHCPQVLIVFDPFHVIASFSRVIDKIRAELYRNADPYLRKMMKRSRFLLLKNPENLTDDERPRLRLILKQNELLASVYLLKDYLKRLWQYKYTKSAKTFLEYWCRLATETGCPHLFKFVKTLKRYSYGLLNHCQFPIHTNRLEGINNKIKVIKRKAYGYRDLEYFSLKIIQATTN